MPRKRAVRFAIVARFTGGAPSDGWLVVEPSGIVTVRRKGRRTSFSCTLDGLAQLVVFRDAQAKALIKAREARERKAQAKIDRRLQRVARGGR